MPPVASGTSGPADVARKWAVAPWREAGASSTVDGAGLHHDEGPMPLTERLRRARQRRDARARGFEVALGLDEEPPADRHPASVTSLRCARCGAAGRLESLDLRTSRGLGRGPACHPPW